MTVREDAPTPDAPPALAGIERRLTRLVHLDGEKLAYLVLFVLAVLTRFWDLGVRVMSHDESLHTRFSWNLFVGDGFAHTPMMHGPLLFHATALNYLLFGDNDFTSRIYTAVIGVIVVMIPLLMRRWLGRTGALAASSFFLISPLILYYSRYIRHDMPSILGALIMAVAIWRYFEDRQLRFLVMLAIGQVVLFMSKEVSFIYIAIFGSFLTLMFIVRLLDAEWRSRRLYLLFALALIVVILSGLGLGLALYAQQAAQAPDGLEPIDIGTHEPLDIGAESPRGPYPPQLTDAGATGPGLILPGIIALAVLGVSITVMLAAVLVGQWRNLRRFPELGAAITIGTLILPMLAPFLIHFAGFNSLDSTPAGVARSLLFTIPLLVISVVIGLAYFMEPPGPRRLRLSAPLTADEQADLADRYDPDTNTVLVQPDFLDWVMAFVSSRWWAIGGPFWLIFVFFFTTMFTNGAGLGTGVIGSLGYWLEQHDVKRGGQPWYYYILIMVPLYEFLPAILSTAAGVIGLRRWLGGLRRKPAVDAGEESGDAAAEPAQQARPRLDLDAPAAFPVLLFIGFWAVLNLIAYSIAGEKMPWLTTHLTTPMILLAGWVAGRLLDGVAWRQLRLNSTWVLLPLTPLLIVALLRTLAPACALWAANPLCNTIVPLRYQIAPFAGRSISDIANSGAWLAALIVAVAAAVGVVILVRRLGAGQYARLLGVLAVGWLSFLTARAAWTAAYINYDDANEFLVYAHSAGAVKDVLEQIETISYKTTDGLGLRVAYDNRVSWPMSWYLRDYTNAVYYGDQPSRGLIGDAPVILAGPGNWNKVEAIIGDRYYQFEYIRMWWPMQDYFGYEQPRRLVAMLGDVLRDPALQRGIWDIFYRRDYNTYADAVMPYRSGVRPNFELSQWPVAERMRVYYRKDIFAQVWDYGVTASEIAQAVDPYSEDVRALQPDLIYGEGLLNRPHGISIGPDGLIYVADSNNHRIVVFAPDGTLVRTLGSYGQAPAPDVLNEPWDVAAGPDGAIYIADTWNHRILKADASGTFVAAWGFEGFGDPSALAFWGPRGIAVDSEGLVYVADTGNKRIVVFDSAGRFVAQIGSGGLLDGQLDEPVGLAIGPDGLLYVADTWNQRIQVFTRDGSFVRQWSVEAWFAQTNERPYLALDEFGAVYVTDPEASRVIVFDGTGQFLYSFGDFTTIGQAGAVAIDAQGYLYVVDTQNGIVQRYSIMPETGPLQ